MLVSGVLMSCDTLVISSVLSRHAAADGIEVFAVALEIEVHMRGIDLRGEVARSEGFAALLQPPQLHGKETGGDGEDEQRQ